MQRNHARLALALHLQPVRRPSPHYFFWKFRPDAIPVTRLGRPDWCSCNKADSYSGGARFESRTEHQISCQIFRSFPQPNQEREDITMIKP
jgi:hypothetical protein